MRSRLAVGSPKLGVYQHRRCVDEFASQTIGSKRHGMAVGAVNHQRELISKPMGIARAESAGERAQATAHFSLVGASNGCARMLTIWELSSEIDKRAATKLWACDLLADAFEQ